jgi:hypothetical protein
MVKSMWPTGCWHVWQGMPDTASVMWYAYRELCTVCWVLNCPQ